MAEGLSAAGLVWLEPVSKVEMFAPMELHRHVMQDISGRPGRVLGTEAGLHGEQRIEAEVPTAEIMRYAIDLKLITGGAGRFSAEHRHYDQMPQHLADRVTVDA